MVKDLECIEDDVRNVQHKRTQGYVERSVSGARLSARPLETACSVSVILGVGIAIGIGIDLNRGILEPNCRRHTVDIKSLVAAAHVVVLDSDPDTDSDPDSIKPNALRFSGAA